MTEPQRRRQFITTATSADVAGRSPRVAVLPVGSFEQHGSLLPLATDALIAGLIADEIGRRFPVFVLPPVTIACSHEHAAFAGTVSVSARTVHAYVTDITESLERAGIRRLVLVNAHGGNYALQNVVQEANVAEPRMALYPGRADWEAARVAAGCETSAHEDMHSGELEVSIMLHAAPDLVGPDYVTGDHVADDRPDLLVLGMAGYTKTGIIGRPSLGTAEKGAVLLDALGGRFARVFDLLGQG